MSESSVFVFTEFETRVINFILAGDHAVLATLRKQFSSCRIVNRSFSGAGFFLDLSVSDSVPVASLPNFVVGGVCAEMLGLNNLALFDLFIDEGQLSMLDGTAIHEPWPEEPQIVSIGYTYDCRDLSDLDRFLVD